MRVLTWPPTFCLLAGLCQPVNAATAEPAGTGPLGSDPEAAGSGAHIEFSIASIEQDELAAENLSVRLLGDEEAWALDVRLGEFRTKELEKPLRDVHLACPAVRVDWPALVCEKATLVLQDSPWGKQTVAASLDWRSAQDWQLEFSGIRYAGDTLAGRLSMAQGKWSLRVKTKALQLRKIKALKPVLHDAGLSTVQGLVGVQVDVQGIASGIESGVASVKLQGGMRQLGWSDEAGLQAAEKLRGRFTLEGSENSGVWRGRLDVRVSEGGVYSDPVFVDFAARPVRLKARAQWNAAREALNLESIDLDAGDMLRVTGNLSLDIGKPQIRSGQIKAYLQQLGKSYTGIVQSLLIGTGLEDLQVEGSATANVNWQAGHLGDAEIRLQNLSFADTSGRFAAQDIAADVRWQQDGEVRPSRVRWSGIQIGKLALGESDVTFRTSGSHMYLLQPVSIPFYGGRIGIQDLAWVSTESGPDAGFSVTVQDVSLEAMSSSLGWPPMKGTINAELPGAKYAGNSLRFDGDIGIRAFDGQMWLRQLRLSQLASAAPVLEAELELRGLDLAKVTETFSFGRIRGRLDGEVRNLQLVAWQPNRFEAYFRSPRNDDLPHKISQRAIEDLTELGNGVSGALASPFLQIFKEFSYDRVELKVAQRGDRAEIGGIPHANGGYYLVKGAGIPRIDVIGRNREVAWNDLVDRLRSIRVDGIEVK